MHKTVQAVVDSFIAAKNNKHLNRVVSKEIEVKFYLNDFDTYFKKLYQKLLPNATGNIEQVLNTITDITDPSNKANHSKKQITERKEIWFEKGARKKEDNIRKSKEAFTHGKEGNLSYQVAFATETKIPVFNTGNASSMRLKYRAGLVVPEFPDWRFDFTIVRTVERNEFTSIKTILDDFFPKQTDIKKFLDSVPIDTVHNIRPELEVEYVGSSTTDLVDQINDIIRFVSTIDQDDSGDLEFHKALGYVADLIVPDKNYSKTFYTKNTLKQLANQPRNFDFATYRNYIVPNITDFYLSDKADGERCFIVLKPGSKLQYLMTDSLKFDGDYSGTKIIIMDAELLSNGTALCFDLMYIDGTATHLPFEKRLYELERVIAEFGKKLNLELKPQVRLTEHYADEIQQMMDNPARTYPIDGLIFTPAVGFGTSNVDKQYGKPIHYFDMNVYKFKPPEKQTIDFLMMRAPVSVLGVEPYIKEEGKELMFLFNGISRTQFRTLGLSEPRGYDEIFSDWELSPNFFPAAFMPSSNPLAYMWYRSLDHDESKDKKPKESKTNKSETNKSETNESETNDQFHGHVGEFIWVQNQGNQGWQLVKLRPDRDGQVAKGIGYGNAYKTAELTFAGYSDPITLEKLMHPENVAYFAVGKSERYKSATRFNAFVKALLIKQLSGSNFIIDLAAGKGQDLFTIHGMGIKNVLFIDKDKEALVELNNRKYNLGDRKYYVFDFNPAKSMNIYTAEADLMMSAKDTITKLDSYNIKPGTADGIIMNFAIHYIVSDAASIDNLIELVNHYLKPGGLFIFTCFDGARVFDFLKATSFESTVDLQDLGDDTPKYSIRKLYKDKTFKPGGLQIGVIHPFSAGEYYTENLVGIEFLLERFKATGYTVLQNSSFGDWLTKFEKFDRKLKLTEADKIYVSLYSYITVAKSL